MGNFERLSVLVIVVIIVLIVVIALVQLTEGNEATAPTNDVKETSLVGPADGNGGTAGMNGGGVTIPSTPRSQPGPGPQSPPAKPLSIEDLMKGQPSAPPAPPAPPVEAPKPEPVVAKDEPKVHVVQPGETIAKIAKIYFPTAVTKGTDAILKANATVDPSRMRAGTKLTIPVLEGTAMAAGTTTTSSSSTAIVKPASATTTSISPGGTYTTRKGDTLASISRRAYGKTERWQDIWLANYDALGDDVDHPAAGIRLKIPR
ncbi:MAG: LysM peptidoglycan-binding domain-containing protein [Planctomycetota bacterium]